MSEYFGARFRVRDHNRDRAADGSLAAARRDGERNEHEFRIRQRTDGNVAARGN